MHPKNLMTAAERLYQLLQTLPDSQINEVLNFAEFLHQKQLSSSQSLDTPLDVPTPHWSIAGRGAIEQMRGLLKTEEPAPTDQEVVHMLKKRRLKKYLP